MIKLYVEIILCINGLKTSEDYNKLLDEYYLKDSNNKLLFDLEECSSDLLSALGRFKRYFEYECNGFNADIFGKALFAALETVYRSENFCLQDFAVRCNALWHTIPSDFMHIEPFWTLGYADDCFGYAEESQIRQLFEKAFAFYS